MLVNLLANPITSNHNLVLNLHQRCCLHNGWFSLLLNYQFHWNKKDYVLGSLQWPEIDVLSDVNKISEPMVC